IFLRPPWTRCGQISERPSQEIRWTILLLEATDIDYCDTTKNLTLEGFLCAEGGDKGCNPFSASLSPLCGIPPLTQSSCQRRYAPRVFGIIPECRSAFLRTSVQLRRNPQLGPNRSEPARRARYSPPTVADLLP